MQHTRVLYRCVGGLVTVLALGTQVNAQTAPDQSAQLAEIVVTAQKRSENLQEVPISAQVVQGQTLAQLNLNSLVDVSEIVPSVHIDGVGRSSELYIRGIGSGQNQSFDQSVGMFIDDIYHGRSRMSIGTFLDLDRVEVLKGPQSTFFGNNAIAGALNIVTKQPGDQFDTSERVLYGQFGQYAAEAAVNQPLSEVLSARVAIAASGTNGWIENVNLDRHVPEENNLGGRVTLRFKPTEDLNATLKVEGADNRNIGGLHLQTVNCPPPSPFVAAGFCSTARSLGLPSGIDSTLNADGPGQEVRLSSTDDVLTVNWQHWNQTFTSVTGFYGYHFNFNYDGDATPLKLLNVQVPEHYRQVSQELRLTSPTDQTIEYMAGLYYQNDHLNFRTDTNFSFLTPTIASKPPFASLVPFLPLGQSIAFEQPEDSYSVFGALTWNATSKLRATGGVRGSWVEKSYDWNLHYGSATQDFGGIAALPSAIATLPAALGLGTPGTLNGSRTDKAVMPSAKLQYQLANSAMAYISYSRGFKAGGFNGADNTGVATNLPYAPEHVNAYELGIKSEWLDRTLLFNAALFRSDYSDLQVATNLANSAGTFISLVKNAAQSRSQGVELEAQWALSQSFRLATQINYLDAYYVSYPNVTPTALQTLAGLKIQDLSGRPTEYAPKWAGSLSGIYTTPINSGWQLNAELTAFFSSSYFISPVDDPYQEQDNYTRLDGRLTLSDGRWSFDIIGKNLTDRTILLFGGTIPNSLGTFTQQKEEPRNFAAQVRFKW